MWKNNNLLLESRNLNSPRRELPDTPDIDCCIDIVLGQCQSNEEQLKDSEKFKRMINGLTALGIIEREDYNYLYSDVHYCYFEILTEKACEIFYGDYSALGRKHWSLWNKPKSKIVIAMGRPCIGWKNELFYNNSDFAVHLSYRKGLRGTHPLNITHLVDLEKAKIVGENWKTKVIYDSKDMNEEKLIKSLFDPNYDPLNVENLISGEDYDEGFDDEIE